MLDTRGPARLLVPALWPDGEVGRAGGAQRHGASATRRGLGSGEYPVPLHLVFEPASVLGPQVELEYQAKGGRVLEPALPVGPYVQQRLAHHASPRQSATRSGLAVDPAA